MTHPTSAIAISLLFVSAMATFAAPPEPVISKRGKLLLSEDFSGPSLPANWKPGGRPNCFAIVDGMLQGTCPPDDGHGPAISVPIDAHDLAIEFTLRSSKPGVFLLLVDGESQFGGTAHLLRLAMHPGGTALQQDRGSLESKREQAAAKAKATAENKKLPPPTKEQLADPKFYRTEPLIMNPTKFLDGQTHRVLIEVCGNEVVAQVDDKLTLKAKGTVLDVKKSALVFLVGNSSVISFDDVKVWQNEPLSPGERK